MKIAGHCPTCGGRTQTIKGVTLYPSGLVKGRHHITLGAVSMRLVDALAKAKRPLTYSDLAYHVYAAELDTPDNEPNVLCVLINKLNQWDKLPAVGLKVVNLNPAGVGSGNFAQLALVSQ